jgi:hypothetical protein
MVFLCFGELPMLYTETYSVNFTESQWKIKEIGKKFLGVFFSGKQVTFDIYQELKEDEGQVFQIGCVSISDGGRRLVSRKERLVVEKRCEKMDGKAG